LKVFRQYNRHQSRLKVFKQYDRHQSRCTENPQIPEYT
jgi:hypothetical protein